MNLYKHNNFYNINIYICIEDEKEEKVTDQRITVGNVAKFEKVGPHGGWDMTLCAIYTPMQMKDTIADKINNY